MRIKLLSAAICIFSLPIFLSPSVGDQQLNSSPFATVAIAGHVIPSNAYCECGSRADCICGPGEQLTQTASSQAATDASTATLDNQGANGGEASAGLMLLALALVLALRLRF